MAKWEAWKSFTGLPIEEAEFKYIELVQELSNNCDNDH